MIAAYPQPRQFIQGVDNRFCDSTGLAFDDVRPYMQKHYGTRVADWPTIQRVCDPLACWLMHAVFDGGGCWECGAPNAFSSRLEAHHVGTQFKKKSDELTLLVMLCETCHRHCRTELPPGRILFLKWKFDAIHLSWVRVCLVTRRFLPDLIGDSRDGTQQKTA